MKMLKDYPMYGYEDGKVWNVKRGKPLAVHRGTYVTLYGGIAGKAYKQRSYNLARVAYCAENGIGLAEIPDGTMFMFIDGEPRPIDHKVIAEIGSRTRAANNKASVEDIDEQIEYLRLYRGYMTGEVEPYAVFEAIERAGRKMTAAIARRCGVRLDTAATFVDFVTIECFEKLRDGKFVPCPRAYISRRCSELRHKTRCRSDKQVV